MSTLPSKYGAYPYQYHQQTDLDDEPSGHQRVPRLNSPDVSQSVHSPPTGAHPENSPTNTKSGVLYSTMEFPRSPGSASPSGQHRGFEWQRPESDVGSFRSAGKNPSTTPGGLLSPRSAGGGYPDVDLDSLLEAPYRGSKREEFGESSAPGHRRGNSDAASDAGSSVRPLSPTSTREKRKSMTAALGEKAFKSPILMKSTTSVTTPTGSKHLHPSEIIDQRAEMTATWGIYWYLPSLMVAVFIAGLIGALGHHAFYQSLHGEESRNQLSMVRIGTAFAFFVKANLVGAVVLAYRQRIWLTMRQKAMKIRAIDALFGIIEDPTFFLTTPEIIRDAKVASLMALVTWLIPIASVISPSSLTSELSVKNYFDEKCTVRVLNFSAENDYDYRNATTHFGNSLAFYNVTNMADETGPLTYDMPSYTNQRLASQAIYNQGPVSPPDTPCPKDGKEFNCNYALTMPGPGYKCDAINEDSAAYNLMPEEMMGKNFVPEGKYIYYAKVNEGDFLKPNNATTYPGLDPDWVVGTFYWEPELWIGYVIDTGVNLTSPVNVTLSEKNRTISNEWKTIYETKIFHCIHYHVNYTFNVSYINTQQSVKVMKIDYLRPIIDTSFERDDDGEIIPPSPSKFLRPGEEGYKVASVYHAVGSYLRRFLAGNIYMNRNRPFTQSEISLTNLVNQATAFPVPDLDIMVQRLHQDILINLWGAQDLVISARKEVKCTRWRNVNLFKYYQKNLWIGYSIVVTVTLVAIIVGAMALRSNGISSDTLFSRILVTTRNPTLDHLSRGACLGSDPFPRELEETKLRFGVWHEGGVSGITGLGLSGMDGKPGHCAFGTIHETTEIVKGGLYAGLNVSGRKWEYEVQGRDFDMDGRDKEAEEEEEDIFYDCSSQDEDTAPLLGHEKF